MNRKIGVLCHLSSLPSKYGIGDLGQESYKFVDFLSENSFNVWQILPLNKINKYNSPYGTTSCFAYEEMYIDLQPFVDDKIIEATLVQELENLDKQKVDFKNLIVKKSNVLKTIYGAVGQKYKKDVECFLSQNPEIYEYCVYASLLEFYKVQDWRDLPLPLRLHNKVAIAKILPNIKDTVLRYGFYQYLFDVQFDKLKKYAQSKNVMLLGDVAIYCEPTSCDVWAHKELFKLDKELNPKVTGGVPDAMAGGCQNWQTCVFNWSKLKSTQYDWWIKRIKHLLKKFDILRLDHFMGFVKHYEIPFNAQDLNGHKWVFGGGIDFFDTLFEQVDQKKIVVEDMGDSPVECRQIIQKYKFKDMRMATYAFDSANKNSHLPKTIKANTIYYIGTHDSKTLVGYVQSLQPHQKDLILKYFKLPKNSDNNEIIKAIIKSVITSKSNFIVFRTQDLLFEDDSKRMNVPGIAEGQWEYRLQPDYEQRFKLLDMLQIAYK